MLSEVARLMEDFIEVTGSLKEQSPKALPGWVKDWQEPQECDTGSVIIPVRGLDLKGSSQMVRPLFSPREVRGLGATTALPVG